MKEYKPRGNWYDVAPGVAYLDDSKFSLSYSGDESKKEGAFEGQRLMAGREIVGQEQRIAEMAEMMGYAEERRLNIPYPDRKADEDSVMAWTRIPPKSMDKVFVEAYGN